MIALHHPLLLCCGLDRTLIPNGAKPETPGARQAFFQFCQNPKVTLAYVSGRDKSLIQQAIEAYQLPEPHFAISDVGSKIYQIRSGQWQESASWLQKLDQDWPATQTQKVQQTLGQLSALRLQEAEKQNQHKLSYYVALTVDHHALLNTIEQHLKDIHIKASLIWSVDEPNEIGLLDILPRYATKKHAIEFLQTQLNHPEQNIIFAGDSGNDLPVLISSIRSILVANASDDIKQTALAEATAAHLQTRLYIAQGGEFGNGNYSSGVLEGIQAFLHNSIFAE